VSIAQAVLRVAGSHPPRGQTGPREDLQSKPVDTIAKLPAPRLEDVSSETVVTRLFPISADATALHQHDKSDVVPAWIWDELGFRPQDECSTYHLIAAADRHSSTRAHALFEPRSSFEESPRKTMRTCRAAASG
jgi:hypothetical protein